MFEFSDLSITEIEKLVLEKETKSIIDFEYIILVCTLSDRYFYINTNISTAFRLSQKAKNLAFKQKYEYGFALSLITYCNCLLHFNKTEEAEKAIVESIRIFRKISYQKGEALALISFAEINRNVGNYLKAFSVLEKSSEIFLSIGEPKGISMTFYTLAKLSLELEDYETAIEYNQKALSYPNANFSNCRIYNNLGFIYQQTENYPKALKFLNKSLYEANLVNDKLCIANTLINIGNVYNAQKEVSKAASYYEHGLSFLNKFGLPLDAFSSLKNLANIQIETKKFDEALNTLNKMKTVALNLNNSYLVDETEIKIASILQILHRNQEALNILKKVSEKLKNESNSELSYRCNLTFSNIFEQQNNCCQALTHYKIYWKERENFLNTKMREKLQLISSKSQIDGFMSKRQIKKEKDIEIAVVYDELVEYTEKLDSAQLKIKQLINQIKLWKSLIPLCKTCQSIEFNKENYRQVKNSIEKNLYLFKQKNTCLACFTNLSANLISPKQIYETANEINVAEKKFEILY
jgi:tetratricopeptide (TPR) repeat protein